MTFSYLGGRINPKSKVAAFLKVTVAVLHGANSSKKWCELWGCNSLFYILRLLIKEAAISEGLTLLNPTIPQNLDPTEISNSQFANVETDLKPFPLQPPYQVTHNHIIHLHLPLPNDPSKHRSDHIFNLKYLYLPDANRRQCQCASRLTNHRLKSHTHFSAWAVQDGAPYSRVEIWG